MARLELSEIPELEGWVSVTKAAKLMGLSKPSIYYMIHDQGLFNGVRRIGGDPMDPSGIKERAYLLIPQEEVERVQAERQARAAKEPPLHVQINNWNTRLNDWGRANGFHVTTTGRPTNALVEAYVEAHPLDPRPARPTGPTRGPAYDVHHPGKEGRE